jgi:predicted nucleotidyltransferase
MQEIEQNRQAVIHRFVVACQSDERVVAAFLGGSYSRDVTDAYSDIDFGLITLDEAYDDFFADRKLLYACWVSRFSWKSSVIMALTSCSLLSPMV